MTRSAMLQLSMYFSIYLVAKKAKSVGNVPRKEATNMKNMLTLLMIREVDGFLMLPPDNIVRARGLLYGIKFRNAI